MPFIIRIAARSTEKSKKGGQIMHQPRQGRNFLSKHGTSALQFFKLNAPARSACQGLTAPKTPKKGGTE